MLLWHAASVYTSKRGISATYTQQVSFGQYEKTNVEKFHMVLRQLSSPPSSSSLAALCGEHLRI